MLCCWRADDLLLRSCWHVAGVKRCGGGGHGNIGGRDNGECSGRGSGNGGSGGRGNRNRMVLGVSVLLLCGA